MALEAEDRTEDLVGGHRSQFTAKQSIAQMPRKDKGDCRLIVEFPFHFPKEFLREQSDQHGQNYIDGVDFLRQMKIAFEKGDLDLNDIVEAQAAYGRDNGIRVEAAK